MIKLYCTAKRLSIQHGASLWTSVQPFRQGINLIKEKEKCHCKCYLQTSATLWKTDDGKSDVAEKRPNETDDNRDKIKPKIILLENDRKVGVMTLEEAQLLVKKRDVKLMKMEQPGKRRNIQDVYQILTNAQLQQEKMKSTTGNKNKGEKSITVSCRISDHDLEIKINSIKKWLGQKYVIRVTVNTDQSNSVEKVFTALQKAAHDAGGKTSQKNTSPDGSTLKFILQYDHKSNVS